MNGSQLAHLMRKHGHRQKQVADKVSVSLRTVQYWLSRKGRAKPIASTSAMPLLKMYMNLALTAGAGLDPVLVNAIVSLEVFRSVEFVFRLQGRQAAQKTSAFSDVLTGTMTARGVDADTRSMLLQEVLEQLDRTGLDPARFVRGLSDSNVLLVNMQKHLGARTSYLRVVDWRSAEIAKADRAWLERALTDIGVVEETLWGVRIGLKKLLGES